MFSSSVLELLYSDIQADMTDLIKAFLHLLVANTLNVYNHDVICGLLFCHKNTFTARCFKYREKGE